MKPPRLARPIAALAGLTGGLLISTFGSAEPGRWALPAIRDLQPISSLEPMRALPRTSMVMAMEEARTHLDRARPWQAWTVLQPYLANDNDELPASAVLLGARAAAEWGGWDHVRELLQGRDWLDRADAGAGWLLLARAEEEAGNAQRAAIAYRRYAAVSSGTGRASAQARLGGVLRKNGDAAEAAAAFSAAAEGLPEIEGWLRALQAEAMLEAGLSRIAHVPQPLSPSSPAARVRRSRVDVAAFLANGDSARALQLLQRESRLLSQQGATAEAARLSIDQTRLMIRLGSVSEARDILRAVAWEGTLPTEVRVQAATLLGEQAEPRTASEELARSAAYEAAGRAGLAARSLRAALTAGIPADGPTYLRLGRLFFDAGDFAAARAPLMEAAARLASPEQVAEAELYAARTRFRGGDKKGGLDELNRIVSQRPGTAAAGSALFLLGDATARMEQAIPLYRRAAAVRSAPQSKEALLRYADRRLRTKDEPAAVRAWEEYVGRYPVGEETARIAYSVARIHARAGRQSAARAMYSAAILADPLSYYAVQAGERIEVDPLTRVLEQPRPWIGLVSDPLEARAALTRLSLLSDAGLQEEWKQELDAAIRSFDRRPSALIVLAEGLRDQAHPVEAIRLGRRLLEKRDGEWDARLLRVIFPFPYRELLESEAARYDVDPMLLAALVRQESTFRPRVRSHVGATGLAQIMPATGRWIAPRAGVPASRYEDELLSVPEVNLRMGALYLSDLMKRYNGAADLALAGYNAGPGRADRWRRELGYDRDVDAFRDAIPFDETRHYVKVVLRNAAVYERLYRPSTAAVSAAE